MPELQEPAYHVEPLNKSHNRKSFSCGKDQLDRYLQQQARQDAEKRVAAPFVLVLNNEPDVLGYYTLSSGSIDLSDFPDEFVKKLPRYPFVPATLIGRLAIDRRSHGQKMGEFLLLDALYKAQANAKQIASATVVVDALDEQAKAFYLHFGFLPLTSDPMRLFLPMNSVEQLF